jgi:phytoene dehydrogenase-like protein
VSAVASIAIIGAGHNGLVAACLLGRAGHDVVVLERRAAPGGCLVTGTIAPGFRGPVLSHAVAPLPGGVMTAPGLEAAGTTAIGPAGQLCALGPDGTALLVEDDRTVRAIGRALAPADAQRFAGFTDTARTLASLLRPWLTSAPPAIDSPGLAELLALVQQGRRFRALGRRDRFRLLQWMPMSIADLTADWFEDPLLRAVVAARGIFGRHAGPRSAGTTLALLMQTALSGQVVADSRAMAGGPGALIEALERAARAAGARLRTNAGVQAIRVDGGRVRGVRLADGESVDADIVLSGAGPTATLLELVDAAHLGPELVGAIRHYRTDGVVAKINLALSGLPAFPALASLADAERARALSGRVHIGPTLDYLEQAFDHAKYGEYSTRPYLELALPTLLDPGLAPAGCHVLSVVAQFAPRHLRGRAWSEAAASFEAVVLDTLEAYAPGVRSLVVASQVITPEDLERTYGLAGGHIHHGEHAPDQLFVMRPAYGWANYRTPVSGLYLTGAGTHPGGGVHGASGRLAAEAVLADLKHRARHSGGGPG